MLDFIRVNWLALISLCVALIGGAPGVVAVLNEWKSRPKLSAYLHHLIPIHANDVWGGSLAGLILHVAIGNKGKEPLVPLAFQLECKINGKWIPFEASSIPEGFTISGAGWQYKYTNVDKNDIQKRQAAITREIPIYGFFSFVSKEIGFEELNNIFVRMPIKLKCTDLFGSVHELVFNKDLNPTTHRHSSLPPGRGVEVSVSTEKK